MKTEIVEVPSVVGKGYKDFWEFRGRYRVCKGSRASKKSKTTALWFISHIMMYKGSNALVVRKVYRTLKDSCFAELKWAIDRLNVASLWTVKESPLELIYKPTGQKILFRGLDDPMKVTSVTVETGYLCWCWIEEAFEISKEVDFDMLDESIRGQVPYPLFKQVTLTFNPWHEGIWIKKRFFDSVIGFGEYNETLQPLTQSPYPKRGGNISNDIEVKNDLQKSDIAVDNQLLLSRQSNSYISKDGQILAKTTNYMCNEFLDDADKNLFEDMKKNNPKRYKVAGLGQWGISDGLIFENWVKKEFDINEILVRKGMKSAFGLDFGYTNDPSALFCGLVDNANKEIFIFDEMYKKGLTNKQIYANIFIKGYAKERIRADSAEPKSIAELREYGLYRIQKAKKGEDSVLNGIQRILDYRIIIHPRCINFLTEISNYTWDKDRFGKSINKPIDDFNHLMDAMRYAMEDVIAAEMFSFE